MATTNDSAWVAADVEDTGKHGDGPGAALRPVAIVFRRELIKFGSDRVRVVSSLVQPILFLLVLGTGLSAITAGALGGTRLPAILFPGILVMAVLFTAVFAAGSIGWDREFGFLREMLVAPVGRASIIVGKCAGAAASAALQGVVILALAGLAGVPYAPVMLLALVGELVLLSFALAAFGAVLAVGIRNMQGFMAVTQLSLLPLFFTSGALFPLSGLPTWLRIVTLVNPLTYAVDPVRRTVSAHLDLGDDVRRTVAAPVTWGSWALPVWLELVMVAVLGGALLAVATVRFSKVR